jgi:hypothetical protein
MKMERNSFLSRDGIIKSISVEKEMLLKRTIVSWFE